MAICSLDLDTIIATAKGLGAAPPGEIWRSLPVSGELIANGWQSWSGLDVAGGRVVEAASLRRSRSRLPSMEVGALKAA
jgi:hypothetical protein